jgi:polar amino acid transport system substrate-binding protein
MEDVSGRVLVRRWFVPLAVVIFVALLAGCDFPRDPMGTLDRVRGGTLRVGVADHEPWARLEDGEASGAEVELAREFAGELGAEVTFVKGTVPELLEAAREGEVDLVIGGLTATDPGVREQKEAAITAPYLTLRPLVGAPPGTALEDVSGREVAVESVGRTAALLKEEGAIPVRVKDPATAEMPVAGYHWQLEEWGMEPTGIELPKEEHVMAVPLGENGWLVELERFLRSHRREARELLREESSG